MDIMPISTDAYPVYFFVFFSCFVFLCSVFLVFLIWAKMAEINKWMDGWMDVHWISTKHRRFLFSTGTENVCNVCNWLNQNMLLSNAHDTPIYPWIYPRIYPCVDIRLRPYHEYIHGWEKWLFVTVCLTVVNFIFKLKDWQTLTDTI